MTREPGLFRGVAAAEFTKSWKVFTNWALENAPGALRFTLLCNMAES